MKLGKFIITKTLAADKLQLAALTEFITANVIILERIVLLDADKNQAVLMIAICDNFDGLPDRTPRIPEYEFVFVASAISADNRLTCSVVRKK